MPAFSTLMDAQSAKVECLNVDAVMEYTRVFPEALFDEVTLQPELVSISPDGILSLTENDENIPLVSMSLFGRRFELDADQPNNFCPSTEFF